mmetsp:Transcript_28275/g.69942  ORF Transcript_28275/g.69942 Transcript_28275/m.69942 type:complete len:561 (+) Transcript_28275:58-1740(+)
MATAAATPVRLVSSSQAKIDELFLQWLSLPESQSFVVQLLSNAKSGKPILNISTNPYGGLHGDPSSPTPSPTKGRAGHLSHLTHMQSPPPRSPTNRGTPLLLQKDLGDIVMSGMRDSPVPEPPSPERAHEPSHPRKAAAKQPTSQLAIPRFYFPNKPAESLVLQCKTEASECDLLFSKAPTGVATKDFEAYTTKVCGYPAFFNESLFEKLKPVDGLVTKAKARAWWDSNCNRKDAETRLFNLLRSEGKNFVTREDWKHHLYTFLNTHPGLEFLKATPEFQERYLECVVERIYYTVNKADNDKLALAEIQKSNLVTVLHNVGEEPDINQILDYFSYEHFYVCYCKFWELDQDHDFLLDKEDLVKLGNYALTYRIVDRIFAGACRPISCSEPDKIGYLDFIWILLSEEDKTNETAIRYWFRGIDLDCDGYITQHEMEFFYKEQLHRMDCLAQEVVMFEDVLCQMTDMVKPEREGYITALDLRRCKQPGVFFNLLFNLTKFIQYDQKDPAQIFHERNTPELTDWDRYAKLEYTRLALEEDEDPDMGNLDMDAEVGAGVGFTSE